MAPGKGGMDMCMQIPVSRMGPHQHAYQAFAARPFAPRGCKDERLGRSSRGLEVAHDLGGQCSEVVVLDGS